MSDLPATHPQQFLPSKLAAGEEYATVSQVLQCEDLPHATLHIPHWRVNGKALAIRVRALSLSERDRALRETDPVAQMCLIFQIACTAPTFTADQANGLADKNPHAVEQATRFIMLLSALDQDWIDHVVTAQTDAPARAADADAGSAADSNAHPRARRVARPPGRKVRTPARGAAADA